MRRARTFVIAFNGERRLKSPAFRRNFRNRIRWRRCCAARAIGFQNARGKMRITCRSAISI